jgi:hypothetical protein
MDRFEEYFENFENLRNNFSAKTIEKAVHKA